MCFSREPMLTSLLAPGTRHYHAFSDLDGFALTAIDCHGVLELSFLMCQYIRL